MARRSSVILLAAFSVLLGLVLAFGFVVHTVLQRTEKEVSQIQTATLSRERLLAALQEDVYSMALLVRDHIISGSEGQQDTGPKQIQEMRDALDKRSQELQEALASSDPAVVSDLRRELSGYSALAASVFGWTREETAIRATAFLREEFLPSRKGVLQLTARIGKIDSEMLDQKHREVLQLHRDARSYLRWGVALTLALAAVIAFLTTARVKVLEAGAEQQRLVSEKHGEELRLLSNRLVQIQEEERRVLSRELHDEVGQILTALRMELGNLSELRCNDSDTYQAHLDEAKRLAAETLKTVRHLATGLRPSILDDLGLAPALRWQAREFSQRYGIDAQVEFSGDIEDIGEKERLCLFRIVQEAVTNCARHAQARSVHVGLDRTASGTILQVRDDGLGFDAKRNRDGIGLLGIEERVRELDGTLDMQSERGQGTTLRVEIPRSSV